MSQLLTTRLNERDQKTDIPNDISTLQNLVCSLKASINGLKVRLAEEKQLKSQWRAKAVKAIYGVTSLSFEEELENSLKSSENQY